MAIKKSQLYSKLWAACDELRGGMDASQYKDYVLVVLFIKYLSDKKKAGDKSLIINLPTGCTFDDLVALKNKTQVEDGDRMVGIGEKINIILEKIAAENDLQGIITNADFADEQKLGKGKDLVETVSRLIGVFQDEDLDFSNNRAADDDLIGDAYEYLMKNFATQSGKSKGQFYTPAEVSRIMAKVIGIGRDDRKMISIYDPTCGSGSLLLRAAAEARGNVAIQGQELDLATIGMAKMSMIIHGVDDADLRHGNTLTDPLHKKDDTTLSSFDYVVANPPFSVKSWLKGGAEDDPFRRWGYATNVAPVPPPKCGDYAFMLHIIASLRAQGHAAVILPHGVLFRGNAEGEIRKFIVERHLISGIIGLPPNLFFGTGIPACIIILDRENATASKGIFMIDAKEGFAKDGAKNRLRECDVRRVVDTWEAQEDIPHFAKFVTWDEIAKNDYNLNIPRYVAPMDKEVKEDLNAHLHGGIPEDEAAKYPPCLFRELRKGYVELALDAGDIAEALAQDPVTKKAGEAYETAISSWIDFFVDRGYELRPGCDPKKLVAEWGEQLLLQMKETAALVDPYAVYEQMMGYWAETLQDDCYLVSRDGWQARLVTPNKRTFSWRDLSCDLLPPEFVVAVRHQRELDKIKALEAEIESAQARIDELTEELEEDDEPPAEIGALKKQISAKKKTVKMLDGELVNLLTADYAAFKDGDVMNLVVDHKWREGLFRRFASELDRALSTIATEVQSLAARYAETLPDLEARVKTLRGKVAGHLKEMGVE